jgi:hypothetical protein
VAELVDAADSKSAIRKDVKVRFLSWAQNLQIIAGFLFELANSIFIFIAIQGIEKVPCPTFNFSSLLG